jgi:hypothetical protein
MSWNSIVFHRNSHTCRPVIAVLATVNEPETGVVCDALLHTNSPASQNHRLYCNRSILHNRHCILFQAM